MIAEGNCVFVVIEKWFNIHMLIQVKVVYIIHGGFKSYKLFWIAIGLMRCIQQEKCKKRLIGSHTIQLSVKQFWLLNVSLLRSIARYSVIDLIWCSNKSRFAKLWPA